MTHDDWMAAFPSLSAWMSSVPSTHPLRVLLPPDESAAIILAAYNDLIVDLEQSKPLRLEGKRASFRSVRSHDDLLALRAELVMAAKLARAGIRFEFGPPGQPAPDLVLGDVELSIEVKSRDLDGLRQLHDELEAALEVAAAPVTVVLACDERPLAIKRDQRAVIIERVMDVVRAQGEGSFHEVIDQPWSAKRERRLTVRVVGGGPLASGLRVAMRAGSLLTNHLADIETEILDVLTNPQKFRQAAAGPTLLVVDAARLGIGWMRNASGWARTLAMSLPQDTPFVGVGVMFPTLTESGADLAVVTRRNLPVAQESAVHQLTDRLGMTSVE